MKEVIQWYLENDIGALKIQTGFNSFVAPSAKHELQIDGFEFKYKQQKRPSVKIQELGGKVFNLGRPMSRKLAHVNPYGLIAINTFTKKVHVETMLGKTALRNIINILGKPKTIYTDPDATVKGDAEKDWFKKTTS